MKTINTLIAFVLLLGACTKDENKGKCFNCKTTKTFANSPSTTYSKVIKDTMICDVDPSILEWYINDNSTTGISYGPGYTKTICN